MPLELINQSAIITSILILIVYELLSQLFYLLLLYIWICLIIIYVIWLFALLKIASDGVESNRGNIQHLPTLRVLIWLLGQIEDSRHEVSVLFDQTCLKKKMLPKYIKLSCKVANYSQVRLKGFLFNSYHSKVSGRALLLSLDCSTLPLICTL